MHPFEYCLYSVLLFFSWKTLWSINGFLWMGRSNFRKYPSFCIPLHLLKTAPGACMTLTEAPGSDSGSRRLLWMERQHWLQLLYHHFHRSHPFSQMMQDLQVRLIIVNMWLPPKHPGICCLPATELEFPTALTNYSFQDSLGDVMHYKCVLDLLIIWGRLKSQNLASLVAHHLLWPCLHSTCLFPDQFWCILCLTSSDTHW